MFKQLVMKGYRYNMKRKLLRRVNYAIFYHEIYIRPLLGIYIRENCMD